MIIKEFRGLKPVLKDVYVASNCTIIGDVTCNKNVSIWYGAILRADLGSIYIEQGSNIQDNCVLHVGKENPIYIKQNVTIGHGAIVHGCTIEENTIIGMNATLLNGCKIGRNCIIGAGSLIPQNKVIPDNSVVAGNPYKIIKKVKEDMVKTNCISAKRYIELAKEELDKI